MSILFVGALAPEFVNGTLTTAVPEAYDAAYAPGALAMPVGDNITRMTASLLAVGATDCWMHFNYYQSQRQISGGNSDLVGLYGLSGRQMLALSGSYAGGGVTIRLELGAAGASADAMALIPLNKLCTIDLHYTSDGTKETGELYIDGLLALSVTLPSTFNTGCYSIQFGSQLTTSPAYFSEFIVTGGGESTLGWRLASMLANSDGHLTEWNGDFANLATVDTTTGIYTDQPNKRHTGLFSAYNGAANPLGIRALVQVGRYIESNSGLTLQGMMYDIAGASPITTFDANFTDGSRVITVWDTNPVTAVDWVPADFTNFEGGFKSLVA